MKGKVSCITKLQGKVHLSLRMKLVKLAADNRAIKRDNKLRCNPRAVINFGKESIRLSHLILDTKLSPKKRKIPLRQERKTRLNDDGLFFPIPTNNEQHTLFEAFNLTEKIKITPGFFFGFPMILNLNLL